MDLKNLRRYQSSSNSMPSLISRLDHLDSMMRYIESKKCSSARWNSSGSDGEGEGEGEGAPLIANRRECVSLDVAVKEAQSKGSILDRITSLEDRLLQLCLEMESEAESPSRTCQEEQEPTSPRISRKNLFSNSFSRFRSSFRNHNHKQPIYQGCMDDFQVTEKKDRRHFKAYTSSSHGEDCDNQGKQSSSKKTKDDKASPKQKKLHSTSLLHMRLLGC